jgi:hypothetical protein
VLVRFLREHRSEWADFNVDAYSAASLKAGSYAYPGMRPTRFTGSQIIMPLGHTIEHEEVCFLMVAAVSAPSFSCKGIWTNNRGDIFFPHLEQAENMFIFLLLGQNPIL